MFGRAPFGQTVSGAIKHMRICIVEDNLPLLENLRLLLEGEPGFSVIGAYASAEEALQADLWARCDALLVDMELPGLSGVDLIRRVRPRHPGMQILVHTISENRSVVFAALKAGAMGYLLKGTSPRELIEALRTLHMGGAPMSPKIARKVILDLQGRRDPASTELLTPRELEILNGIAWGKSYKELAQGLGISVHTVHTHIKHVYEKLQAANRSQALQKARSLGVL